MRFLVDQNILFLTNGVREAGHDVVGLPDYGMAKAEDSEVIDRAEQEDRIIITRDVQDFSRHIALYVMQPSLLSS